MGGSFLSVFVGLSSLVFMRCAFSETECGVNRVTFGGRLVLASTPGQDPGVASPWAGKKLFIFQTPRQSGFSSSHGGRGRLWVTSRETTCDRPSSSQQYCPSAQERFPCIDSSRPCHIDWTKPSLTCPLGITKDAAPGGDTLVTWEVTCEDDVDASPSQVCSENNGTSFGVGTTGVNCSCTDDAGNRDTCSFNVTLIGMPQPIVEAPTPNNVTISLPGCGQTLSAEIRQWVIVVRNQEGASFNITKTTADCYHRFVDLPPGTYTLIIYVVYIDGERVRQSDPAIVIIRCSDLEDLSLSLRSLSRYPGHARIVGEWSYHQPTWACPVLSHNITVQLLDPDNCQRGSEVISETTGGEERNFNQRKLLPFSLYRVTVYVITETRVYNVSEELRTVSTVPTGAPILMAPVKKGQGGIKFEWQRPPCHSRHGTIIEYEYVLSRRGRDMEPARTTARRVISFGFSPNDRYGLKVSACTDVGCGPYSEMGTWTF